MAKKLTIEKTDHQLEAGLVDAVSLEPKDVKPTLALANSVILQIFTPDELRRLKSAEKVYINIVCADRTALRPIGNAVSAMCKGATRVFFEFEKGLQSRNSRYHSILESFAGGEAGVVLVTSHNGIPDIAKIVGERTVTVNSISPETLAQAIRQSLPGRFPKKLPEIDLSLVDFETIAACMGSLPDAKSAVACLVRAIEFKTAALPRPPASPVLEEAVEFGEAQRWGLDLKRDIADYKAGKITWKSVDRGAVLHGPPGTGKSLFAASLATACGVPLIATSVAEYFTSSDGHLGDVLKRQKATFDQARAKAPCILFLDEINSLPDIASLSANHSDWWRPVVLDFFVQLDSLLSDREGVVVVTATNSLKDVSQALLRNGRLERAIYMGEPDARGVERILRHHLGKDLATVGLEEVSHLASGSTPATIMGWVRSAQRKSRRRGRPVTIEDLRAEILGSEALYNENEIRRIAVHEAGHAFAAAVLPGLQLIDATLVASENRFGQVKIQRSNRVSIQENLENEAAFLLAGHAAEIAILGSPSTGSGGSASSDLGQATGLISSMFTSHGFDQEHMVWRCDPHQSSNVILYDPTLRTKVAGSLKALLTRLQELILDHRGIVEAIADELIERRYLSAATIHEIAATDMDQQSVEKWIASSSQRSVSPLNDAA